jgi:hypothetical protein
MCRALTIPALIALLMVSGCAPSKALPSTRPAVSTIALAPPDIESSVDAEVRPPLGWKRQPLKTGDNFAHQLWVSPTGQTAYGVIRMRLPLPAGPDFILWIFMREMRKEEKVGILISKERDPNLPGLRFVADGAVHRIRSNLITRGRSAWTVYAGTIKDAPVVEEELELAIRARETTLVGPPARSNPAAQPVVPPSASSPATQP